MKTNIKTNLVLTVAFSLLPICIAYSEQHIPQAVIDTASKHLPTFKTENAAKSPIDGLFRVSFGPNILYISADGRYVVDGQMIDIIQGVNLTDIERSKALTATLKDFNEDNMIVFAPEQVTSTITVFTDITCPYCVKLHQEVPQLNDNGVKVRYLAYPRAGIPSAVADDMVSVWCADDPHQAITDAKAGLAVTPKECPNPVNAHYDLGVQIGIKGTPTIILEDGNQLGGYIPYAKLAEVAQQAHAAATQSELQ